MHFVSAWNYWSFAPKVLIELEEARFQWLSHYSSVDLLIVNRTFGRFPYTLEMVFETHLIWDLMGRVSIFWLLRADRRRRRGHRGRQ